MAKMKVVVIEDVHKVAVREMDIPTAGPGEVLAKIYQSNICTTDWQTWAGLRASQGRKFPWPPGHEMAGEIVALGEGARPGLKVGMRVGFLPQGSLGCGECEYCRSGHISRCRYRPTQITRDGLTGYFGMAQYVVYPSSRIFTLADDLPFEEGGYLEPVATAVHGVRRLRVSPGENVLVIGAGNLGLVNAQVARVYGGRVMVSEISPVRCQLSESLGFYTVNPETKDLEAEIDRFTGGKGMDAVILAVGVTSANEQAIKVLAPMGRILMFAAGYPAPGMTIDSNTIHYKEYELIGTYLADLPDLQIAAELLSTRAVKVDKLISHKVPVNEVEKAFELAATPGNYRVSISMW
ncbi:MAG: alcohol dehydrogenase catalytic domain-containing protein [Negativicutes bacterium]|nr:alcohol dehydrogenase catalytic domain-containing protein [Negativicutes bacterium]